MTCSCTTKQPFSNIFLCLLLFVSLTSRAFSIELNMTFQEVEEVEKMKLIRNYLLKMNKHAEKTIKSPDGDIIDCVLFYSQPAFDHPLLSGKIQTETPRRSRSHEFNSTKKFQLWNANSEKCPDGTIPIRRIIEEEILRSTSLEKFGMKPDEDQGSEFAFLAVGPGRYYGGSAGINIWTPEVSVQTELSSSKIWVVSVEDNVNSIEAGWLAYPHLYGDNKPRLFVSWTVDSFASTGCYNLLCPGFVHTNPNIALGTTFDPSSTLGGEQHQYTLSIEKDQSTGNWILYGEKSEIGYWPSELLPALQDYAALVSFGGEITNSNSGGFHTTTQMGSGHFPSEGYRRSAYVGNIQIFDTDGRSTSMFELRPVVSDPNCYDAYIPPPDHDTQLGLHILYGGPGRGPSCL